ncbi:MAG: hypothetical protein GX996_08685 [Firmicutes bacterium]|nr:hypothetical protein [Bacillota bacterium]
MAGPAIDPQTGEFLQPGLCPLNPETNQRECPPTTEMDCLLVEKVFDQCFTEDVITREFAVPRTAGEACENVDLTLVNRVECAVLNADCTVVDVSQPLTDNVRIITVRQDVEVEIELWHDPISTWQSGKGTNKGFHKPKLLCTFTESITDFYNQLQLYVPPPGVMFGPSGGPFVFCEVVNSTCYCIPATVPPGDPVTQVICTVKICKILEVTAFVKLLVPLYGYCIPRPCEAAPQQKEIECPPVDSLFPPQQEEENGNNNENDGESNDGDNDENDENENEDG